MTVTACRAPEVHSLRVGYTLPSLEATLYEAASSASEQPIDLTDVVTVRIIARRQGKDVTAKIDRTTNVDVLDATAGEVRVNFLPGDVDEVGRYDSYFVLTYSDGRELPVPNPGFFTIAVGRA